MTNLLNECDVCGKKLADEKMIEEIEQLRTELTKARNTIREARERIVELESEPR
jgi:peptidoglycan hydrolase CwlO-like protein